MVKKVTYNLNFLAKYVFELDKEWQKILQILAGQKEDDKGINQTQITSYFSNLDSFHNRKTINRQLFGTSKKNDTDKKNGLIPNEYVIPKKEGKKRFGKEEITFHLTFKGLFGALASGVPLKKIYSYRKFLKVVDYHVKDKKINEIIKKYYELQIHSFLLWHYIYGIQLKNMTMFQTYYSELDEKEFSHIENFGVRVHPNIIKEANDDKKMERIPFVRESSTIRDKEKIFLTKIMEIFSAYFTYKGIISVLRINGIIPTANDFLKPDIDARDSDEALDFDKLIDHWSIYIEGVHLAKEPSDILNGDTYLMPHHHNITFLPQAYRYEMKKNEKATLENVKKYEKAYNIAYIPNVTDQIRKMLKENKIDVDIPESVKRSTSMYPF